MSVVSEEKGERFIKTKTTGKTLQKPMSIKHDDSLLLVFCDKHSTICTQEIVNQNNGGSCDSNMIRINDHKEWRIYNHILLSLKFILHANEHLDIHL